MVLQNVNINIRLPKYLRDKFIEVTQQQGLAYSLVLRNLMKQYIQEHNTDIQVADTGGNV